MAISTAMATSFKAELMKALHNFSASGGNVFKIALYVVGATIGATTTAYSATNEIASTGGYSAGGSSLTNVDPTTSGTTAFTDFNDVTWAASTITANGAEIYNSTNSNRTVSTHAFGADKTSTGGDFVIQFPVPDASNAILRLA